MRSKSRPIRELMIGFAMMGSWAPVAVFRRFSGMRSLLQEYIGRWKVMRGGVKQGSTMQTLD
jgi:hypothetical protein